MWCVAKQPSGESSGKRVIRCIRAKVYAPGSDACLRKPCRISPDVGSTISCTRFTGAISLQGQRANCHIATDERGVWDVGRVRHSFEHGDIPSRWLNVNGPCGQRPLCRWPRDSRNGERTSLMAACYRALWYVCVRVCTLGLHRAAGQCASRAEAGRRTIQLGWLLE